MAQLKPWLIVVGAAVVATLLAWFGIRFLRSDPATSTELFVLGCFTWLGAILLFSAKAKKLWPWCGGLLLVGIYFFARSSGVIDRPWLLTVLGLACLLAAFIVAYIGLATANHSSPDTRSSPSSLPPAAADTK